MTRNYVALFISMAIILSALLEGAVGEKGMLVNAALGESVLASAKRHDRSELELHNLQTRFERVWEVGELLDEARIMGYVQSGETVYYFMDDSKHMMRELPSQDGQADAVDHEHRTQKATFVGINRLVIRAAAVLAALLMTVGLRLLALRRERTIITIRK